MYEGLETNIPHFLMEFSDLQELRKNQLFPSRDATLQYLRTYGKDVRYLVKFKTQVTSVSYYNIDGKETWLVDTLSLGSGLVSRGFYDAVVVASGHYSVPHIPYIPGANEWNATYKGVIAHSKFYQRPQDFAEKKVLVVGNSASGHDISTHISSYSKSPVMVSLRSNPPIKPTPLKVYMPEIAELLPPSKHIRAVRFSNGHVETHIDAVVFCTGYLYSYPFLSSIVPQFIDTGDRVKRLFEHIFSIDHPSLAFAALPKHIVPFRTFEGQAAVISRVWAGRLVLPSKFEMLSWEQSLIARHGTGKRFHHLAFPDDLEYHNSLVDWAQRARDPGQGKMPPRWTENERIDRAQCATYKELFETLGEARHEIRTVEDLLAAQKQQDGG